MFDIIFLTTKQQFGIYIANDLRQKGIKVTDTFGGDSHRKKVHFFMNSQTIKITTLHSFKGWESRAIVIYINEHIAKSFLPLVYTGLTKLKQHLKSSYLTVISTSEKLKKIGQSWSNHQKIN